MSILTIIKALPIIIELIKVIEDLIPGVGKGEEKLAMLRTFLETIYGPISASGGLLEKIVSIIVGMFNSNGTFQTTAKVDEPVNEPSPFPEDQFKNG